MSEVETAIATLTHWTGYARKWEKVKGRESEFPPVMVSSPEPIPMDIFNCIHVVLNNLEFLRKVNK